MSIVNLFKLMLTTDWLGDNINYYHSLNKGIIAFKLVKIKMIEFAKLPHRGRGASY